MDLPGYSGLEKFSESANGERYIGLDRTNGRSVVVGTHVLENGLDQTEFAELLVSYQALSHPNLGEINDVGVVDPIVYFAMPYYPGGSLSDLLAQGLSLAQLLDVVQQICNVLEYLHERNSVHGDIKPSNIVFNDVGEAVLIDSIEVTPKHLALTGTPGYAAPEVRFPADLTPQADIYSLGMLLLRVLYGELPWVTQTTGLPRAREEHDLLPALSEEFTAFTNLIEGMVAYLPSARYASIAELRTALSRVEVQGSLLTHAESSDLISTRELAAVLPSLGGATGNAEPQSWRALVATGINWGVIGTVVLSGILGLSSVVYEQPYSKRLLSEFGIVENVALVEAKLNAATLAIDPKQNLQSILAAYEAVLAIDPSDVEAKEGIDSARSRWETEFENALLLNELSVAQNRLNDLLAVSADEPRVIALVEQLETRRHALRLESDTMELLQARGSITATSADMALHAFREVLRLYPSSSDARRQLDELAGYYSDQAIGEIARGNIQAAMDALSKATRANPNFDALEGVREQIQLETTLQEEIQARLERARQMQLAGNLIEPEDQNAALLFHSVLTTDPDNEVALQGLGFVSETVVEQFDAFLDARDFDAVNNVIERSKNVALYPASIMHMESSLESELRKINEAASFVDIAERFVAQGFITMPLDSNAVNALRNAHYLDPTNTRIAELYQHCIDRLQNVADDARLFGLTTVSEEYAALADELQRTALQ